MSQKVLTNMLDIEFSYEDWVVSWNRNWKKGPLVSAKHVYKAIIRFSKETKPSEWADILTNEETARKIGMYYVEAGGTILFNDPPSDEPSWFWEILKDHHNNKQAQKICALLVKIYEARHSSDEQKMKEDLGDILIRNYQEIEKWNNSAWMKPGAVSVGENIDVRLLKSAKKEFLKAYKHCRRSSIQEIITILDGEIYPTIVKNQ